MRDRYEVTGWTPFFRWEEAPLVFYWDFTPELSEELNSAPYRNRALTEEERESFYARMVRTPWSKIHGDKRVQGIYKIVGDRLFRVLSAPGEIPDWDESIRAIDGLYDVQRNGRAVEEIWDVTSNKPILMTSAGWPLTIKACEERIAAYILNPSEK